MMQICYHVDVDKVTKVTKDIYEHTGWDGGHNKDHHKNGTNCLPAWHTCVRVGVWLVRPDCEKGRVLCGAVYGDMHYKDLLGSIARVGCCIPVP